MNARTILAVTAVALSIAACRADHGDDFSNPNPGASATPAASPDASVTPDFPQGIYVSPAGSDAATGSTAQPLKTIHAAIARALSAGEHDIFLIGANPPAVYREVVVMADGVNLHGDVCAPSGLALVVDASNCRTILRGGSPSLIADALTQKTVVEDLEVSGIAAVESRDASFVVPGIGCVGRGSAPSTLAPCTATADTQGRVAPASSIGASVNASADLRFARVTIASSSGGVGYSGAAGDAGLPGVDGFPGGSVTADDPSFHAVAGAGAPSANCAGASRGLAGGNGGFLYSVTMPKGFPVIDFTTFTNGAPALDANGNAAAPGGRYDSRSVLGRDGADGAAGVDAAPLAAAAAGTNAVDALFVAGNGADGLDGTAGTSGLGGAGGAPAIREGWTRDTTLPTHPFFKSNSYGAAIDTTVMWEHDHGEAAGGAGGGGASAGCGGKGGRGGQGGGSSIALVARSSNVTLSQVHLKSGNGGIGGEGGQGGDGGAGGVGGASGLGRNNAETVPGTFSTQSGLTTWTPTSNNGSSAGSGLSPSVGGKGGRGGSGGRGSSGANGGAGAGGATVGMALHGGQLTSSGVTTDLGLPGASSDPAATGLSAPALVF